MVWSRAVESSYAVGFNGVNDYADFASQIDITGDFSISFFMRTVRVGIVSGWRTLLTLSNLANASNAASFYIGQSSQFLYLEGAGANRYFSRAAVTDGKWHHVVLTRSSNVITVYVDGLPDPNTPTQSAINRFNGFAHTSVGEHADFAIDEVRVYNRQITAAEVQSIYRNSSSPPTSGLVCYFPLDEGTGTTVTDTIGGLTGTLTNGPTWQPQVSPRLKTGRNTEQSWSGSFARASTQYVSVPNAGVVSAAATYAMWVKPLDYSAIGQLFYFHDGTEVDIHLMTNGYLKGYLYNGGYKALLTSDSGNVCPLNAWTHIAFSYDGTTVKWYVNGRLNNSTAQAGAVSPGSAATMDIGRSGPTGGKWNGLLKDARKYSSALSAANIADLANNVEPGITMAGHWKLDDGTGTTATDSSGNGNHGTLTNGPTWTGDIPQWFRPTIESSHSGSFDGVDDAIQLGSSSTLNPTTAMTVTAHIYVSESSVRSTTYWPEILSRQNAGVTSYHNFLLYNRSGNYRITLNSNVGGARYGSYDVPLQRWVPVAFSDNGSALSLWANGVQDVVSSGLTTTSLTAITGNSFIGNDSDWAGLSRGAFPGRIDEVCVHNIALPAAAIADAAAGYLVRAGLVSRYKLDGNANDSHGTNHGTEQGGVSYSSAVPATIAKRPRRSGLPFA